MIILITKDYPDPREGRNKIIRKNKKMVCDPAFGEKAVKDGYAKELNLNPEEVEKVFKEIKAKTDKK